MNEQFGNSRHITQMRKLPGVSPCITIGLVLTILLSLLMPLVQEPVLAVGVPNPLKPADGVTITATGSGPTAAPPVAIPEFSWSSVPDTTGYRLQLSQDIAFSTKVEYTTANTTYTPPNVSNFNDGIWFWRVRVENPTAGEYSPIRSFTRQWASLNNHPNLLSPADGGNLEFYDPPAFSWSPVIGAAAYLLQISASSDFSALLYNQTTLATTHQPTTKLANGTYYWRVIPLDPNSRLGTYSEVRMFVQSFNRVPELVAPANGSLPTFTPTFQWKAVRGAQYYKLQYSTDPSFNTGVTTVDTRNTTYTPQSPLPNDVNYYWRVRSYSGDSLSDWSMIRSFRKQWYIRPVLLTPTNLYQHVRFPTYTWTPVPGASFYRIEIDKDQDFVNTYITAETSNNYYTPYKYEGAGQIFYWRVTPLDRDNHTGKESLVSSYYSIQDAVAPDLIAPEYYYPPNTFPPPDQSIAMHPYADRTVALPVFYWQRLTAPPPTGGSIAYSYVIQISTDPLFGTVTWSATTENTHAAPTQSNPFVPLAGQDYYWRVRARDQIGVEFGDWSQIWKAHIDLSRGLTPKTDPAPVLLRPAHGAEFLETTPLLEWWPKTGADSYDVQISADASFSAPLVTAVVPYSVYSPTTSLAQRLLNKIDYGTYYWRVRARSGGSPLGSWSQTRRFQVASQSERMTRTLGNSANRLLIATDPDDTADNNFELTTLNAAQDPDFWFFGFNATTAATNMTYALYLDLDHLDNSGASSDPRSYTVSTIPAHRPEIAIYVNQVSASFSADQTAVYQWNGTGWDSLGPLSGIGGSLYYDAGAGYVELQVSNTAIRMQDDTGSYALSLFSLPSGSGSPQDSVPSDPNVPGSGQISRFASVSEHVNLVLPANNTSANEKTLPFVPPFYWDYPTGSGGASAWNGARMRVYLDQQFTTQVGEYIVQSNGSYYASTSHAWPSDLEGDNTYYWRIQPCYGSNCQSFGSWTQGWRFDRKGFIPQNLQESISFAMPTFSWDMVEGARYYELQVDGDPNFGSPDISIDTAQTTYTSPNTLNNGLYYWRVRVVRYDSITNEWSVTKSFNLNLPYPTNLSPNDPNPNHAVDRAPTFCWTPLIKNDSHGVPVLAAYKYRLQVSYGDPSFSSIYEQIETEQACYTPSKGYDDGTFYWRVAMMDGLGKLGEYSPAAVFTKQYPPAKPLSPANGSNIDKTPTFIWTAKDGVTPYVFGAASYRLEVSQSSTFTPLYDSVTTNNTRYTPTKLYDLNLTLYWRVAMIDKDNKIGPFSDAIIIGGPPPASNHVYLPNIIRK